MKPAKVILKRGRANPVWRGHPWIFSGSIETLPSDIAPGGVVAVHDFEQRLIGYGFANPRSQITVRMFQLGEFSTQPVATTAEHSPPQHALLQDLFSRRFEDAALLRRRIGLPSSDTTAYRLFNSEGDGLPGLVIDRFGDVAVVQFSILGMQLCRDSVHQALRKLPQPPTCVVENTGSHFAQIEGLVPQQRVVCGDEKQLAGGVSCSENGLRLRVDVKDGQKTGAFLDQRENRLLVARHCAGAKVLDLYSYMGGFALTALRHGATEATCVDSSEKALRLCTEHSRLNDLPTPQTVFSDVFHFLEAATPLSYDVTVVDPPKFARAHKDLEAALKGYRRLNALALATVRRGGLLATCSCSQLVDEEVFLRMLATAASDAGRRVTVLYQGGQGPDHPVPPAFAEGRYLKFVLLGVI